MVKKRIKIKNKKGLEMVWSTYIAIILGVILLIALIVMFTQGSLGFVETIKSYFSYSNLDTIVSSCNVYHDSNSVSNFCCQKVNVKYYLDGKKAEGIFSCYSLEENNITNGRIKLLDCSEVIC